MEPESTMPPEPFAKDPQARGIPLPIPTNGFCPIHTENFLALINRFKPRLRLAARTYWLHALMSCRRFDEKNGLKRGQFYYGRDQLSKAIYITTDQIRTIEKHLLNAGEIHRESTNENTTITCLRFSLYVIDGKSNPKQIPNKSQTNPNKPYRNEEIIPTTDTTLTGGEDSPDAERSEELTTVDLFGGVEAEVLPTPPLTTQQAYGAFCAKVWRDMGGNGEPPYGFFGRWKKAYGQEFVTKTLEELSLSVDRVDGKPERYMAKVLSEKHKHPTHTNGGSNGTVPATLSGSKWLSEMRRQFESGEDPFAGLGEKPTLEDARLLPESTTADGSGVS